MKWSFSAARTFAICPRRWFYANVCANARAKDRKRKQAYHLKQLQTLSAWRGSLVDTVINVAIVPKLNNNTMPSESDVLNYASTLASKQIEFGKARQHKASKITKSGTGTSYCAFYDLEYNDGIREFIAYVTDLPNFSTTIETVSRAEISISYKIAEK